MGGRGVHGGKFKTEEGQGLIKSTYLKDYENGFNRAANEINKFGYKEAAASLASRLDANPHEARDILDAYCQE